MSRTDDELLTEIDKKILELNSFLFDAVNRDIRITIEQRFMDITTLGEPPKPRLVQLSFSAEKTTSLRVPHYIHTTGY